jgi:hypothetical protein
LTPPRAPDDLRRGHPPDNLLFDEILPQGTSPAEGRIQVTDEISVDMDSGDWFCTARFYDDETNSPFLAEAGIVDEQAYLGDLEEDQAFKAFLEQERQFVRSRPVRRARRLPELGITEKELTVLLERSFRDGKLNDFRPEVQALVASGLFEQAPWVADERRRRLEESRDLHIAAAEEADRAGDKDGAAEHRLTAEHIQRELGSVLVRRTERGDALIEALVAERLIPLQRGIRKL